MQSESKNPLLVVNNPSVTNQHEFRGTTLTLTLFSNCFTSMGEVQSMIKELMRKIIPKKPNQKLESDSEIKSFKDNAWKSKKMANTYHKEVEHVFFDNITANIFLKNIENNSYVLDVGAGTGRLSLLLADNNCKVLSCDISKEMLRYINKHKGNRNIETLESSANNIPLENEMFDAVVSMDFMLHFPDWEDLLKEQARLCKKGGIIMFNFLSSENTDFLKNNRRNGEVASNFFAVNFAPFANEKQIEEVANRLGLNVEAMYPYNFFTANSIFGCNLTKNQVDTFTAQFNEAIKDENVMNFVKLFEENIVRNLPISCSVTMIIKLRKI
jgi:ubiquinone/menaquinone biosynthesis C-methylase UbiE